ncbi:MAG: carboxynorspermidine decarboxylase [Dysgonamonadaceae bacterium]|jgi:carboxynorspermidine decarboxylase|nr:carboxynorspermidine decarboxylase [Dysgonamonadaceae bacterium]
MLVFSEITSPAYVIEESLLRRNLALIRSVKDRAGVDIILAFKAFAMWKAFPIIREYIGCSTASSPWEARLAVEEMGSKAHTYSPAYTERDFQTILDCSSHITFNSLAQFERFYPKVLCNKSPISCGLRINPEYSEVETDLYNPATPGSRLGLTCEALGGDLPEGVEGLHFHTLCESSSFALEHTLEQVEAKFGSLLPKIKWLNMGGGHLMTRKDYDVEHLIALLKNFKAKYPKLKIILEPGAAFVWQTGVLVSTVIDVVESGGIKTAVLDVSFSCHMPDCLEMPYQPVVRGAEICEKYDSGKNVYRLGGNSCLSGDYVGFWTFDKPLAAGDRIIFEDMIHYTTVKTTMFNGIPHPDLCLLHEDGTLETYRRFGYEDYKQRMS